MGMVGVLYGYVVRNLRKPKKDFCLSIGLVGMNVCGNLVDTLMRGKELKLSVRQFVLSTTRVDALVGTLKYFVTGEQTFNFSYSC